MHPTYLPFTEQQLLDHFAEVRKNGECIRNENHLEYYKKRIERYKEYLRRNRDRRGKSLKEMRTPRQVEKDERFWTAACMMTIFHSRNRIEQLIRLLKNAYGNKPPVEGVESWKECLGRKLHLFFEANLPSPMSYKRWLKEHLSERQFIPYVLDCEDDKINLEGPTNVDAILLNPENGFAVVIEAKVLSDISHEITYDTVRNQIARNIDVMLEENENLCPPLDKRDPEKTLFLLITPKLFKDYPASRLYVYKFHDYKNKPNSLSKDLPHRENYDWHKISDRLGWLTWEDFKNVNKNCCEWSK